MTGERTHWTTRLGLAVALVAFAFAVADRDWDQALSVALVYFVFTLSEENLRLRRAVRTLETRVNRLDDELRESVES